MTVHGVAVVVVVVVAAAVAGRVVVVITGVIVSCPLFEHTATGLTVLEEFALWPQVQLQLNKIPCNKGVCVLD